MFDGLTKIELEEIGREHGIELDRRKTRSALVSELREVVGDPEPVVESAPEPTLLTETPSAPSGVKLLKDGNGNVATYSTQAKARSVGHKKGGRAVALGDVWAVKLY